jgi:multimeric flavodoxin WrbA
MKALVINASPHMDKGNTALILTPFVEGMREAGADVEIIYTNNLKIEPCDGCYTCWFKTPDVCVKKDDMASVLPKLEAEIWVLAAPLYLDGMAGSLKMLLDRTIPLMEPFFELRDGHVRHAARGKSRDRGKVALVSSCGFWEMHNFDPLAQHIRAFCKNADREFAGALLRPHGIVLRNMIRTGSAIDVIEAAKDAGIQLVQQGKINDGTLKTVSRELMPLEKYLETANSNIQRALDVNKKTSDG